MRANQYHHHHNQQGDISNLGHKQDRILDRLLLRIPTIGVQARGDLKLVVRYNHGILTPESGDDMGAL
jgi:hypothetical protein